MTLIPFFSRNTYFITCLKIDNKEVTPEIHIKPGA